MEKKKIKKENYIILGIITIIVVLAVLILRNLYLNKLENDFSDPIIRKYINNEIKLNDYENYINDNDDVLLYVCVSSKRECRNIEKGIKEYVRDNLKEKLVYLNLEKDEENKFINNIASNYKNIKLNIPVFMYYKNGKLLDYMDGDTLTVDDVKLFVSSCGVL